MPQQDWASCKDDACTKCGGKRFKTIMGRLVPVRVSSMLLMGLVERLTLLTCVTIEVVPGVNSGGMWHISSSSGNVAELHHGSCP